MDHMKICLFPFIIENICNCKYVVEMEIPDNLASTVDFFDVNPIISLSTRKILDSQVETFLPDTNTTIVQEFVILSLFHIILLKLVFLKGFGVNGF